MVILVLCALSASNAFAENRASVKTLDERLQRVERVMDQSLLDQLQRIDSLQREIRALRGEIESLNYELDSLKKRNTDLYADSDRRITDLEEAQATGGLFGLGGETGGLSEDSVVSPGLTEDTATSGSVLDESSQPRAVVVPEPGTSAPVSSPADFGSGPTPPKGPVRDTATQAEKAAYTRAYDLLARGQNDAAVASFDEFLQTFPDGPYSDNAWYWQGEAKYAQREFEEALRNFGVVVNSFPNSTKVPDARLKIGYARYEQKEYAEARRILTGVQDDYPGRSAAVLARKRLQQMDRENR
ncbi:MAG: tol-pal system protein YbgF [Granulosicoccus sp.]